MTKRPLREADEPKPYDVERPVKALFLGANADAYIQRVRLDGGPAQMFSILMCDGCGRWQEFDPPHEFAAVREKAQAVGWRTERHGGASSPNDYCPICAGN